MARQHKEEHYMHWTHHERGRSMTRRIHLLIAQTPKGLIRLKGENLPDSLVTYCETEHAGKHVMEMLLNPKAKVSAPYVAPADPKPWPGLRDLANVGTGFLFALFVRFFLSLVEACL